MALQKNRQAMPTKKKLVKQKATILFLCHKSYLNQVSTRTEKNHKLTTTKIDNTQNIFSIHTNPKDINYKA
jgi:hypothetical protein